MGREGPIEPGLKEVSHVIAFLDSCKDDIKGEVVSLFFTFGQSDKMLPN